MQDLDHGNEDANKMYILLPHKEAAKRKVPVKVRVKQHLPWEDENIISKRETARKAYEVSLKEKARESVAKLEEAKKELREAYMYTKLSMLLNIKNPDPQIGIV